MTRPARIRALARRIGRVRLAAAFILLVAALLVARFAWHVPLAADAERAMYDTRVVLTAPRVDQDPRVVMVVFNDDTLAKTGRRSPLDRALLARALRRIDALGATGIGIDILIDQPEPEDPQLIAALRAIRTPTFLAFATNATNEGAVLYWQEQFERRIARALRGTRVRPASILLQPDMDGVIRSWPAGLAELPPLLADLMTPGAPRAGTARSIAFRLPAAADRPVFESLPIDLFDSDAGAAALRSQIAGRRVLIGGEITDTDRFDTPLTKLTGQTSTGLGIHAALIAQRLSARQAVPLLPVMLWVLALLVVAIGASAGVVELDGWRFAIALGAPLAVIVLLPFGMQASGVDTQGLPAFGWLVGWTLAYSAAAATARALGSEQRRFAQGALGRYLPRDVANAILRDPDQLKLHGERRTIFALFSDLEGFTKLTHAIAPETTATLLNRYLDTLSNVVLDHGGTIDKFVGDAVVAFWGAPIARADDGDRSLAAAMAMVEAGEAFRRDAPDGVPPIGRTRVGLHRGEAIVGNFGGEGRIQYTALGDAMNAAARLEGANKTLMTRALVSGEAASRMTDAPLRPMGRVAVRGRSTPIAVFEPVPDLMPADAAAIATIIDRYDAGDLDALAVLDRRAAAQPGDTALARLVDRLRTAGPGGYNALD